MHLLSYQHTTVAYTFTLDFNISSNLFITVRVIMTLPIRAGYAFALTTSQCAVESILLARAGVSSTTTRAIATDNLKK